MINNKWIFINSDAAELLSIHLISKATYCFKVEQLTSERVTVRPKQ